MIQKLFLFIFVFCGVYSLFQEALASIPKSKFFTDKPVIILNNKKTFNPETLDYRIGPSWDRQLYKNDLSRREIARSQIYEKLLKATARVKYQTDAKSTHVGSAIYLGLYEGQQILMTNHHVLNEAKNCNRKTEIYFLYSGRLYSCKNIILTLKEYDLTLFSIFADTEDRFLKENKHSFSFENEYDTSSSLYTAGHGYHKNSNQEMTADISNDCQLMRSNKKVLYVKSNGSSSIAIPSIIHSCELSPGDSGSVIVDRQSGNIIGLNYFVGKKRSPRIMESGILEEWKNTQSQEMFESLSYAVPSEHIRLALLKSAQNGSTLENKKNILKKIVEDSEKNSTANNFFENF